MIVVADTTPIITLLKLKRLALPEKIFRASRHSERRL